VKNHLLVAAVAAALTGPIAADAKPIAEKAVLSGKVKLDPSMGYIFVSGGRSMGMFLRVPDASTRAVYEQDRRKAFVKAQKRYVTEMQQWEYDSSIAKKEGSAPPPRPDELKFETFSIDPIELRETESFGPMNAYGQGDRIAYLNAVKPGTYIYYGPILMGGNGAFMGTCYCLGSVRFEVRAGVVTDLGNALVSAPQWDSEMDVARLNQKELNAKRVAAGKEPIDAGWNKPVAYGLPQSLASWPAVRAEFHANPKMNNYYGVLVSRLAPIPGILAYKRDTIVDARTGMELQSPTLVSRARIKK
jgi:hypothetical protein